MGNDDVFLIDHGKPVTHTEFAERVAAVTASIRKVSASRKIPVVLEAENKSSVYTNLIALLELGHPVLPCPAYQFHSEDYRKLLREETGTDFVFAPLDEPLERAMGSALADGALHPLIASEIARDARPLLLRTSGTSGKKYKFVLHDHRNFRKKHERIPKHYERTLAFSPAESVAGIETLTEALCHRKCLVVEGDRLTPPQVAQVIREKSIDYLQTTPTFLNLLLFARALSADTVGSLRKIAYGSEPPVRTTLETIKKNLPGIELMHTYGMTEIGICRTRTNPDDPTLFVLDESYNPSRFYGPGDNLIEVRSMCPLVGYLNAAADLSEGWFRTNDSVERSGAYLRVMGRADDTLNVAGRKFFPSELEELLMAMPDVADVLVCPEKNDLIGMAIVVKVFLGTQETEAAFRARLKTYCEERVPFFMHPHRVILLAESPVGTRFKKVRK